MTAEEARAWLRAELGATDPQIAQLDAFKTMVVEENVRQNLVSAASIDDFWNRHILDSAQLLTLVGSAPQRWLDLGTGAGFPGMVIAILRPDHITFVESRRKRIDFLTESMRKLGLFHVNVAGKRLETFKSDPFSVITARAFAPMPRLFELAHSFSTEKTRWILPKGRSALSELESVRASWHGMFHVKPSVTDADAAIIVAEGVRRIGKR